MKAILKACILVASAGVATALAGENVVRVAAGTELRLGIVDTVKSTNARNSVHQAFAESLSMALAEICGEKVSVKVKAINADAAAFGLGGGAYDAVLVLGTALPRALITSDTARLTATLGAEKEEMKAFLIFNKVDEGLDKLLRASFAPAVGSQQFLDALDGGIDLAADPTKERKLAAK